MDGWHAGSGRAQQLPVVTFFLLALAWSWAWWWSAAVAGFAIDEPSGLLLYVLGVFGPLVGAIWVVRRGGRRYRREFLRRVWDPRGISGRWWLALVAVAVGPAVLGAAASSLTGRGALTGGLTAGAVLALTGPAFVASLAEEPGWRGAVLDAWQTRSRPVWAATGIGALWSLWHLPLSFIEGTYYHDLGAGSARVWLTHLMLVPFGILLVWLVNGSGGSILFAVLAHTGLNPSIGVVPSSTVRDVVVLLGLTAAASAAIIVTKGRLDFPSTGPRGQQRRPPLEPPPHNGEPGTERERRPMPA